MCNSGWGVVVTVEKPPIASVGGNIQDKVFGIFVDIFDGMKGKLWLGREVSAAGFYVDTSWADGGSRKESKLSIGPPLAN
jgi:hypothetical protein